MKALHSHSSRVVLNIRLWACLFGACSAAVTGRCDVGAGGNTCGNSLLQVDATRQKQLSTLASTGSSCPVDGQQCTLIVLLKDSFVRRLDFSIDRFTGPFAGVASVKHLKSLVTVVLDFGKHHSDECCKSVKRLQKTYGVKSVEFDVPVYAIGKPETGELAPPESSNDDNDGGEDGETEPPSTPAATSPPTTTTSTPLCPPDGVKCNLIVALRPGANSQKLAAPFEGKATASHLDYMFFLDFGNHQAGECCTAYKTLQQTGSVKSVEFDESVRVPPSPSPTAASCPADGKKCTIIVVVSPEKTGAEIAAPYVRANATFLDAIGQVVLSFGEHQATECCDAFKALQKTDGVESAEWDSIVHAIDQSGARLACLWPAVLGVLGYAFAAFY